MMSAAGQEEENYWYRALATAFFMMVGTLAAATKTFSGKSFVLTGYGYPGCRACTA